MHELSLAMSIVDIAQEEGERLGGNVSVVHLRVGKLVGVVKEALLSCYDMAIENTPLEGSTLVIEEVPIVVYCPICQETRTLDSVQSFSCAICGTPTTDIRQGKELEVVALEVEQ